VGAILQGFRVYPDAEGWLPEAEMSKPGAFGRLGPEAVGDCSALGWWQVTAPSGERGSLNPAKHTVVEHEDGTITVAPSIDFSDWPGEKWHGWLRRGVWESV